MTARVRDNFPDEAVVAGVIQNEGENRFIFTDISSDEARLGIAEEDAITLSEHI